MKHFAALLCMFFILQISHSQIYHSWTWVNGGGFSPSVYGTKGTAAPNNTPGARGSSISWTDSKGNFWLFGGLGYDINSSNGFLNDLWKWDGANWAWVSGGNTISSTGSFGAKGVASPTNVPPARAASVSWIDNNDNLWLFGGTRNNNGDDYNDLWKWDGSNWTWVSGTNTINQSGVYGIKGTPNANNVPGARQNASSWVDNNGNFCLFGGGNNYSGAFNDLWKWDGANWTWFAGSSAVGQISNYGTKGVAAASNVPGARGECMSWKDNLGNFWLFGGDGLGATSTTGIMNDLWKWDGSNWIWVSGSNTYGNNGIYGSKGVAAANNVPGARYGGGGKWVDKKGNMWLFGGHGMDQSGNNGILNDLWEWDGANWTWVTGSNTVNQAGIYGTKGTPSTTNTPGARTFPVSLMDNTGNLWLFGGYYISDLWKFDLASSVLPVTLTYFNGTLQNKKTMLNWATATETNNKGFAIERGNDGINFKQIDFVAGNGTITNPNNYVYTDVQPLVGKNYYRLKQVDLDGHFTYSNIVTVNNISSENSMTIYPNPTKDFINISTTGINGAVEIVDLAGRLLKTVILTNNNMKVDVKRLPAATYICKAGGISVIFVKQ